MCLSFGTSFGACKHLTMKILPYGDDRHYDRHNYMDEKTVALLAWEARLWGRDTTNVLPMKKAVNAH